jgi:hypothetical protein
MTLRGSTEWLVAITSCASLARSTPFAELELSSVLVVADDLREGQSPEGIDRPVESVQVGLNLTM